MLRLLEEIADAVENAVKGSERALWNSDEGMGADGTETHGIDRIAESAALSVLEARGNPLNVVSEECGFLDFGRERTLIMDPIDGTYNAIMGLPFYSVSLAIAETTMSDASFALVRNLTVRDEFTAEKGKGAYRNGKRIHVRAFSPEDSVFSVMLGKRAHDEAYRISRIPKRLRSMGSAALETAAVASGSLDLYYYKRKEGGIRVVDIAGSALILREAGGEVYNADLLPLDMDFDVKRRESLIAVGDPAVLEVFK